MVVSKVSAGLRKIRRTLTDAFRQLKHVLFLKKIELRLQRKKRKQEEKAKQSLKTPKKAEVKNLKNGGEIKTTKPKRPFKGKTKKGTAVAKGCGAVMENRRKRTQGAVRQF